MGEIIVAVFGIYLILQMIIGYRRGPVSYTHLRTNTGCPVFLTACCYLVIGNPAVIIMRLKYNVHSLIYSKPIFEEKREPENKKIFLFVLFIGNPLSETWFLRVSWLQQFFS